MTDAAILGFEADFDGTTIVLAILDFYLPCRLRQLVAKASWEGLTLNRCVLSQWGRSWSVQSNIKTQPKMPLLLHYLIKIELKVVDSAKSFAFEKHKELI